MSVPLVNIRVNWMPAKLFIEHIERHTLTSVKDSNTKTAQMYKERYKWITGWEERGFSQDRKRCREPEHVHSLREAERRKGPIMCRTFSRPAFSFTWICFFAIVSWLCMVFLHHFQAQLNHSNSISEVVKAAHPQQENEADVSSASLQDCEGEDGDLYFLR